MSILHATTGLDLDDTAVGYAYRSTADLRLAYWLFRLLRWGWVVRWANWSGAKALSWRLPVEPLLRSTLGRLFLGGETLEATLPILANLRQFGVEAMLDFAVEAAQTEKEAEMAFQEYQRLLRFASQHREQVPFVAIKLTALAPPLLFQKLSQEAPLASTLEAFHSKLQERLEALCQQATAAGIGLMIDAEESWLQKAIDTIAETYMARYNTQFPWIYTSVQMYRRDRLDYLKGLLARAGNYLPGIKLVRGAYVEKERAYAAAHNQPDPIHPTKAATDIAYDAALMYCLERLDHLGLCVATHNRTSCMKAAQYLILKNWDRRHPHFSFSQLYGMADPLSFGLAKGGFRVIKYLPYGPLRQAFPYLARRAEENSSLSDQSGRELRWIAAELERRRQAAKRLYP
ncbi:MAG: proline dehydrogenase family protein [Bacteroidia bacterium]|nr:proline dehydrogenase family protein [Bacteroidia bacterium]MDW8089067.1 proline dehydrogenase family protein [Bacteroidia bacterium]